MADLQTPLVRRKRKKVLVDYLVQFRWILVIFVVLPFSALIYLNIYLGDMWSAMKSEKRRQKEHEENVDKVVKRLKQRNPKKDGLVCTARKPWIAVGMRNVDYKRARHFEVDLSAFRNILEIDKERMIAKVEPLVNMGQITRATCPMNLALAVVAELDDLTVGGLINGYGIEGSSHIYGLFSDTVIAMEVVLADGRVVRATKDNEYSDLFYGMPWSQGTLGFLVSAEIKLIPTKEYMRLTYTPVKGTLKEIAQAYADSFAPRDGDPAKIPDFVEGMVYSSSEGVIMTGVYATEEEAKKGNKINRVGWWFMPWFYQYAQAALKKGEFMEYIPTREYYHRHTRSLYWEGKLILPFGDQFWFRFLLGWLMPPKVSLLKLTQGEAIRNYYHDSHVIQVMLVPLYKVGEALEFVHREMEVYPLWLCPHRLYKLPVKTMVYPEPGFELHQRQGDTSYAQMFTDIGVYYAPAAVLRGEEFNGAEAVHRLEPVAEPGGAQAPLPPWLPWKPPLQILWRKKKEGENFEEEEGMRGERREEEEGKESPPSSGSWLRRWLEQWLIENDSYQPQWLIENHSYQPQYAVSELSERDFWRMFDASHYEHCRRKYGAVGTLMSVYYKSKKGNKTEEVQEAEAAILEPGYAEEA